eukprot:CAMPEP_0203692298 /NCGR_PEP_ID=MMETSP0091-20130426/4479_1 /ASSEMBLY_ACC=CAM_ASM_001089 /TAXON_ID=426623 /ORGANISM="Chaetoceros affinis, Strain CCMP159" /LENGTH=312 /DNA_ID=CAMNT_0050563065 /DNA_START=10 /DNA_END=948 /DNA_ORIENTATION=+
MWNILKSFTLTTIITVNALSAEGHSDKHLLDNDFDGIIELDSRKTIRYNSAYDQATTISNDLFHHDVDIKPFHLIASSVVNLESNEIKKQIVFTIEEMVQLPEYDNLDHVSLEDISVTTVNTGDRFLKGKRYLTQQTQIDVEGGSATFSVETWPYHVDIDLFNEKVLTFLESNLDFGIEGMFVDAGSGSIYSPSAQPSESVEDEDEDGPSAEVKSVEVQNDQSTVVEKGTSVNSKSVVVGSLLAVLSVGVAATVYLKKRRRNFNREISGLPPRDMKRDLDFEQFVVECCTDNPEHQFDDDQNYFTYPSQNHH